MIHGLDYINLFFPTSSFFEKSSTFLNNQCRLQRSSQSMPKLANVYDDDVILFCIVACTIATIFFGVFYFSVLFTYFLPSYLYIVSYNILCFILINILLSLISNSYFVMNLLFASVINVYFTDLFSKCSNVLSKLSQNFYSFFRSSNYL